MVQRDAMLREPIYSPVTRASFAAGFFGLLRHCVKRVQVYSFSFGFMEIPGPRRKAQIFSRAHTQKRWLTDGEERFADLKKRVLLWNRLLPL